MRSWLAYLLLVLSASPAAAKEPSAGPSRPVAKQSRPNILWLTSEDHGPHMGCFGDKYATTPNVDSLAARGMRYTFAWSSAPVCAPARTTLISGLYPPSTGSEHMRSMLPYPAGKKMFPQYLREAGYYCSNRSKEDYNLTKPGKVWDDSSRMGHWRNRKAGQPFFAVFNSVKSHESQVRIRPHQAVHDPAKVRLPAYHPDRPEVRRDWAQYYDKVTEADAEAGLRLKELADDGLAADTIVFYFADNGPGLPRGKRSACDSGLHVPLVVYIPPKFRHLAPPDYKPGGESDRPVSFIDFAPTVLVLAGLKPPSWMHGHAFLGHNSARQPFNFGFRGRMDERPDLSRVVSDGRFVYVRHYMPHIIPGQYLAYMFQTPTTRVWKQLHDEGKLTAIQDAFWKPKPPEELFDLRSDPDEVKNLANDPAHAAILQRLRKAHREWAASIRDVGLLPERELHTRFEGKSPYDAASDDRFYPFRRVFEAADLASNGDPKAVGKLRALLGDKDSAVRYWAALGLRIRGAAAVGAARDELAAALQDQSPDVKVAAAGALARFGSPADQKRAVETLADLANWGKQDVFTAVAALNALDDSGSAARAVLARIKALPTTGKLPHRRYSPYVPRLLEDLLAKWK